MRLQKVIQPDRNAIFIRSLIANYIGFNSIIFPYKNFGNKYFLNNFEFCYTRYANTEKT